MSNSLVIKKIKNFKKSITVSGDKSISIRWVLFSSLSYGTSKAKNLLLSEDVLAAIKAVNKLGIKSELKNNERKSTAKESMGSSIKNITINAKNSGTLARLILGFLINSPYEIN